MNVETRDVNIMKDKSEPLMYETFLITLISRLKVKFKLNFDNPRNRYGESYILDFSTT